MTLKQKVKFFEIKDVIQTPPIVDLAIQEMYPLN